MEKDSVLREFSHALYEAALAEGGQIAFLSEINAHSHLTHDIDVVVDRQAWRRLSAIIGRIETRLGWQLVQMIQYDLGDSVYFVIGCLGPIEGEATFVKFDILRDDLGLGTYGIRSDVLLETVEMVGGIPFPTPERLLTYLVQKRLTKGEIDAEQFSRLVGLCQKTNDGFDYKLVTKYFPKTVLTRAYELLNLKDFEGFAGLISGKRSKAATSYLALASTLMGAWYQAVRLVRRVFDPVGFIVVLPSEEEGGRSVAELINRLFNVPFRGRVFITVKPPRGFRRMALMVFGWLVLVVPEVKGGLGITPCAFFAELAEVTRKRLLSRCDA